MIRGSSDSRIASGGTSIGTGSVTTEPRARLPTQTISRVLLIVCVGNRARGSVVTEPVPIEVPPLAIRESELPRIIDGYGSDAIATLGAPPCCFSEIDRAWVM